MNLKPTDFLLGILDFFSVLLPGAVLTYFLSSYAHINFFNDNFFPKMSDVKTEGYIIFLMSSFLFGHFLFAISSFLDQIIYDRIRGRFAKKNFDITFQLARKIKNKYVIAKPSEVYENLRTSLQKEVKKFSVVQKIIEVRSKKIQENKKGVNFKISRWLFEFKYLMPYWRRGIKLGFKKIFYYTETVVRKNIKENKEFNRLEFINVFKWSKAFIKINQPEMLTEINRLEADSKFFRSFFVVMVIILCFQMVQLNWFGIGCCILFGLLSLYRYAEQRFKSTQTAYEYIITIDSIKKDETPKENKILLEIKLENFSN